MARALVHVHAPLVIKPSQRLNLGGLVRLNSCAAWIFATCAHCMHVKHCVINALPFTPGSTRKW